MEKRTVSSQSVRVVVLTGSEVAYADFFEPPKVRPRGRSGTTKKTLKNKSGKKGSVRFEVADEDEGGTSGREDDEDEGEAFGTMNRVKGDLFGDEEDQEEKSKSLRPMLAAC